MSDHSPHAVTELAAIDPLRLAYLEACEREIRIRREYIRNPAASHRLFDEMVVAIAATDKAREEAK